MLSSTLEMNVNQNKYRRLFVYGILLVLIIMSGILFAYRHPLLTFLNNKTSSNQILNSEDDVNLLNPQISTATGPLRVSSVNERYFADEAGRIVVLAGSHTWANLQEAGETNPPPTFNYPAYLNYMQSNNMNFFRLWAWEQTKWAPWTSGNIWFTPSVYARTGPGTALDEGPKFNLDIFNQSYFDRLRDRVIQAGAKGIYVSIMLFDGWSIGEKDANPGNPWPGHPYNGQNNINGVNGDENNNGQGEEIHTLNPSTSNHQKIMNYQKAYVKKVIDTVNDLDNVLYEISNESPSNSQAWQYDMINFH